MGARQPTKRNRGTKALLPRSGPSHSPWTAFALVSILGWYSEGSALPPSFSHASPGAEERVATASEAWLIALPVALEIVPDPVGEFLLARIDRIRPEVLKGQATPPQSRKDRAGNAQGFAGTAFVCLNTHLAQPAAETPGVLVFDLPRDRRDFAPLLDLLPGRNAGTLPWDLFDSHERLVQAWREGDERAILSESAAVTRLSVEAALPFNTVCGLSSVGALTRASGDASGPSPVALLPEDRNAAGRFHSGLMRRLRPRLEHEVRVFPGRYEQTGDPFQRIRESLTRANGAAGTFLAADQAVRNELQIREDAAFAARAEAYYILLGRQYGHLLRERLEDGALLAADLLGTAWHVAGRPSMPEPLTSSPEEERATVAAPAAEDSAVVTDDWVGSRTSDKFHRASCTHTRRIRPENLVRFSSVEEARAAGRSPCTVCRPDEPRKDRDRGPK